MPIEIRINADTTADALAEMEEFLRDRLRVFRGEQAEPTVATPPGISEEPEESEEQGEAPAPSYRPRGVAGEGRKRRTKEEMVEDDQLEDLARRADVSLDKVDELLAKTQSREQVTSLLTTEIDSEQQIRNDPENRTNPEDETAADDAADQAEDVSAEAPAEIDMQMIREALGKYSQQKGMPAATKLLRESLGYVNLSAVEQAGAEKWESVYKAITQELRA